MNNRKRNDTRTKYDKTVICLLYFLPMYCLAHLILDECGNNSCLVMALKSALLGHVGIFVCYISPFINSVNKNHIHCATSICKYMKPNRTKYMMGWFYLLIHALPNDKRTHVINERPKALLSPNPVITNWTKWWWKWYVCLVCGTFCKYI